MAMTETERSGSRGVLRLTTVLLIILISLNYFVVLLYVHFISINITLFFFSYRGTHPSVCGEETL
jgi:flagellar biosynthesis protein FliP